MGRCATICGVAPAAHLRNQLRYGAGATQIKNLRHYIRIVGVPFGFLSYYFEKAIIFLAFVLWMITNFKNSCLLNIFIIARLIT